MLEMIVGGVLVLLGVFTGAGIAKSSEDRNTQVDDDFGGRGK